jgi:hypothetical protein
MQAMQQQQLTKIIKTEKSWWVARVGCPFNDYQLVPGDYPVLARTAYF